MGEWPEATYAALCQAYAPRDPFAEFGHGVIDLNTLRILIEQLPVDSAMHRAHPDSAGWRPDDYLLAEISDGISALFNLIGTHGNQGYQPPEPRPRPGDEQRRARDAAELAAKREADDAWARNLERLTGVGR